MNAAITDTINFLNDFFVVYPDNLYVFIKHLYSEHDAGWFTYFIGLCIFFYLFTYVLFTACIKKYKTRDALRNVAFETKSQFAETKNGEGITDCRYSGRIFEIDNSNPKVNPYIEFLCSFNSDLIIEIKQSRKTERVVFKMNSKEINIDEILTDAEFSALYNEFMEPAGRLETREGKIAIPIPFNVLADEGEPAFIDEQKIYDSIKKVARFAELLENRFGRKTHNGEGSA